jgi:Tol biopolymer transport system component/predicted DNA-binding transcriptional regulator AlpA
MNHHTPREEGPQQPMSSDRLDSWKEISAYLGRGVTTVQRWERDEGLPIRRHLHATKGSVFAYRAEIDAWLASRADAAAEAAEPNSLRTESAAPGVEHPRTRRWPWVVGGALLLTAVVPAVIVANRLQPTRQTPDRIASAEPALPQPRAIATESGYKGAASLSPDGDAIVYIASPDGEPMGLFVRPLGGGPPRRILSTPDGTWDGDPSWSPDGRRIVFSRLASVGSDVLIVDSLGRTPPNRLTTILGVGTDWVRDGRSLLVSDRAAQGDPLAIYRVSLVDGVRTRLSQPAPGTHGDLYPAASPDGRWVAFARWPGLYGSDVWAIPAAGGEARRLTFLDRGIDGIRWMPDSQGLLVASGKLWFVGVDATSAADARLVGQETGVKRPTTSWSTRDGRTRVAYTREIDDANMWRLDLRAGPEATAEAVAPSSGYEDHPALSPDGQQLAFSSSRTGDTEIWAAKADGRAPRQLTFRGGPTCISARWSPDGRRIAFASRNGSSLDIYVVAAAGGLAQRIASESSDESYPTWSGDGRFVYFRSTRGGTAQLWKVPTAGGAAVQITRGEASQAFEAPDGKLLYFVRSWDSPGLWSVPTDGGPERLVVENVREGLWAVCDEGVLFVGKPAENPYAPQRLLFYRFRDHDVSFVRELPADQSNLRAGFCASRDARFVYLTRRDWLLTDVMLIDDWPFDRGEGARVATAGLSQR